MTRLNTVIMDENIKKYLDNFEPEDHVVLTDTVIQNVQKLLNFKLPPDYIEFIRFYNGAEGEIGDNSYLCLFGIEELKEVNSDYVLLVEQIPDYYLFGKDAADTGYAFHKLKHSYHEFGLMSDFENDSVNFCGNSFYEFIQFLYNAS